MIGKARIPWKNKKKYRLRELGLWAYSKILGISDFRFCIGAFILGMASIKGLRPFGLPFVGVAKMHGKNCVLAAVFSVAGVFAALRTVQSSRYILAFAMLFVLIKVVPETTKYKEAQMAAMVFTANTLAGAAFMISQGISPYDILSLFMESSLGATAVFVLPRGLPWIYEGRTESAERTLCLAIMAGVVLPIASGIEVAGINLREVLGVLGVLVLAHIGGPGAGTITGTILGLVGFSSAMSPWIMALLAFSGLLAGCFNSWGKVGVFMGFTLGYFLFNLYVNSLGEILIPLPVVVASFLMLWAVPSRTLKGSTAPAFKEDELAQGRICEIASAVEELGKAFDSTVFGMSEKGQAHEEVDRVLTEVRNAVCVKCPLKKVCWEMEPRRTAKEFYELLRCFDEGRYPQRPPEFFRSRCKNADALLEVMRDQTYTAKLERGWLGMKRVSLETIRDHYRDAAKALRELAQNLPCESRDISAEGRIRKELARRGVVCEGLYCHRDDMRYTISMVKGPCVGDRQCDKCIPDALRRALGEKMEISIIDCPMRSGADLCRIKAKSRGDLQVTVGVAGIAKGGGSPSGDGFSFMKLNRGQYLLALADGMGVGKKAAQHSDRALAAMEGLLEAGFDSDSMMKIVNSTLLASTSEEGFSTMDLALIDTCTGRTKFLKSGAPSSFIKRGSKVLKVEGGSLPVGILDEVKPIAIEHILRPGDMLLMITDGVVDSLTTDSVEGEKALARILSSMPQENPQISVERILKISKDSRVKDDMTAMIAHIKTCSVN